MHQQIKLEDFSEYYAEEPTNEGTWPNKGTCEEVWFQLRNGVNHEGIINSDGTFEAKGRVFKNKHVAFFHPVICDL